MAIADRIFRWILDLFRNILRVCLSPSLAKASLLLFFIVLEVHADEETMHDMSFGSLAQPWFTGPLIAPSGSTVRPGHVNVQPYFFMIVNTGSYTSQWHTVDTPNFYTSNLQVPTKIGICKWLDFQFALQASYNQTRGVGDFVFGDLPVSANFQLLASRIKQPWPAIKLGLRANIPCGKYQQLRAAKRYTDVGGTGNWEPGPVLTIAKLWNLSEGHFLDARLSMYYRFRTPVFVKGLNAYGGAPDTRGTVYPGNQFSMDGAIQYNFNQRWAFACDLIYVHADRTTFSGRAGLLSDETPADLSAFSNEQFSLAPALEYNLSKNLGFIGGVWFTFAGRNSTQFITGVISFNAYL